jgi:hypothetical protein
MKIAFKKYKYSWFFLFCLAAVLAIVACNVWLICCGRCVVNDYLMIPPIGWALISANLLAGAILYVVKRRMNTKTDVNSCGSCHVGLLNNWTYCPNCGDEHHC